MHALIRVARNGTLAGFGLLACAAHGGVVFQDNFETAPQVSTHAPIVYPTIPTDDVDADPVAQVGTWWNLDKNGAGSLSEQVTSYTSLGPPAIGPHGGSNYLRMQHNQDTEALATFTAPQTSDVRLDTWIYVPYVSFRVFMEDSAGHYGNLLSWGEGAAGYLTNHNGIGFQATSVPYTLNTWQHLIVDFHIGSASYDVSLDGISETGLPMSFDLGVLPNYSQILFAGGGTPAALLDDVQVTAGASVTPQWTYDGTGDWNVPEHWSGSVPNSVGAVANFLGEISANRTVYTDTPVTVGTLRFNSPHKYLIAGLGSLTLSSSTESALVEVLQGTHEINLPLYVASSTTINTSNGATLMLSDPVRLASGITLNKSGTGTLVVLSTLRAAGPATIKFSGGVVNLDAANNDPNISINIDPATLILGASQTLGDIVLDRGGNLIRVGRDSAGTAVPATLTAANLTVSGGGGADTLDAVMAGNTIRIRGALQIQSDGKLVKQGAGVLVTSNLDIGDAAQLDVTEGKIIVDYSGATPIDSVRRYLQSGGIHSSTATGRTRLGYGEAAVLNASSFGGEPVDSTAVLLGIVFAGDANLDGSVDITDLARLATAWQTAGLWTAGDFDYSGFIDISDLGLLATNWRVGANSSAGMSLNDALAGLGLSDVSVPEPAQLAVTMCAAIAAIAKGRRRCGQGERT